MPKVSPVDSIQLIVTEEVSHPNDMGNALTLWEEEIVHIETVDNDGNTSQDSNTLQTFQVKVNNEDIAANLAFEFNIRQQIFGDIDSKGYYIVPVVNDRGVKKYFVYNIDKLNHECHKVFFLERLRGFVTYTISDPRDEIKRKIGSLIHYKEGDERGDNKRGTYNTSSLLKQEFCRSLECITPYFGCLEDISLSKLKILKKNIENENYGLFTLNFRASLRPTDHLIGDVEFSFAENEKDISKQGVHFPKLEVVMIFKDSNKHVVALNILHGEKYRDIEFFSFVHGAYHAIRFSSMLSAACALNKLEKHSVANQLIHSKGLSGVKDGKFGSIGFTDYPNFPLIKGVLCKLIVKPDNKPSDFLTSFSDVYNDKLYSIGEYFFKILNSLEPRFSTDKDSFLSTIFLGNKSSNTISIDDDIISHGDILAHNLTCGFNKIYSTISSESLDIDCFNMSEEDICSLNNSLFSKRYLITERTIFLMEDIELPIRNQISSSEETNTFQPKNVDIQSKNDANEINDVNVNEEEKLPKISDFQGQKTFRITILYYICRFFIAIGIATDYFTNKWKKTCNANLISKDSNGIQNNINVKSEIIYSTSEMCNGVIMCNRIIDVIDKMQEFQTKKINSLVTNNVIGPSDIDQVVKDKLDITSVSQVDTVLSTRNNVSVQGRPILSIQ